MIDDDDEGQGGLVVMVSDDHGCEHAEQVMHLQTVLAVLAKRAGGRLFLSEAELEAVVGQGVRMTFDEESGGIIVQTFVGEMSEDLPLVTHAAPNKLQ